MKTWIVVAHRAGAKLFSKDGINPALQFVEELPYPDGLLRAQQINTDFDSSSNIAEVSPEEHKEDLFVKILSVHLNEAELTGEFDKIVLVADAKFLSKLENSISSRLSAKVLFELKKNLAKATTLDIQEQIERAIHGLPGRVA